MSPRTTTAALCCLLLSLAVARAARPADWPDHTDGVRLQTHESTAPRTAGSWRGYPRAYQR